MTVTAPLTDQLAVPEEKKAVFRDALDALQGTVPFSVGGALALYYHTGIRREVHDFDVHVIPEHVEPALRALAAVGFDTLVKHPQWLAQAWKGEIQVDLVFGQGSWQDSADERWVAPLYQTEFLDRVVSVIPPEELIVSKALRCSRIRHDSADVFHILVGAGDTLDWRHLVDIFGEDWEVLLSHLIMFRYVFPSHADVIPDEILDDLLARLEQSRRTRWEGPPLTRGQMLDSSGAYRQYIEERGYVDERQRRWEQRVQEEPVLKHLIERARK